MHLIADGGRHSSDHNPPFQDGVREKSEEVSCFTADRLRATPTGIRQSGTALHKIHFPGSALDEDLYDSFGAFRFG